jgi:hypothetical protein
MVQFREIPTAPPVTEIPVPSSTVMVAETLPTITGANLTTT